MAKCLRSIRRAVDSDVADREANEQHSLDLLETAIVEQNASALTLSVHQCGQLVSTMRRSLGENSAPSTLRFVIAAGLRIATAVTDNLASVPPVWRRRNCKDELGAAMRPLTWTGPGSEGWRVHDSLVRLIAAERRWQWVHSG